MSRIFRKWLAVFAALAIGVFPVISWEAARAEQPEVSAQEDESKPPEKEPEKTPDKTPEAENTKAPEEGGKPDKTSEAGKTQEPETEESVQPQESMTPQNTPASDESHFPEKTGEPAQGTPGTEASAQPTQEAVAPEDAPETEENEITDIYRVPPMAEPAQSEGWLWPLSGHRSIAGGFGKRLLNNVLKFHCGIDVGADRSTPVYASRSGKLTIKYSGCTHDYPKSGPCACSAEGNWVVIDHGDGDYSGYFHFSKIVAENGAQVEQGDIIGYCGATGYSTGVHLHFAIRHGRAGHPEQYGKFAFVDPTPGKQVNYIYEVCREHVYGETEGDTCLTCGKEYDYENAAEDFYAKVEVPEETAIYRKANSGAKKSMTEETGTAQTLSSVTSPQEEVFYRLEEDGFVKSDSVRLIVRKSAIVVHVKLPDRELPAGKSFGLAGEILSEEELESVRAGIYRLDGTVQSEVQDKTGGKKYDLSGKVNRKLRFGKLEAGVYVYKVYITSAGRERRLINHIFTIA